MSRLAREGLLGPLSYVQLPKCISCIHGKITRKPFPKASRSTKLLETVHSDICGPMSVKGKSGAFYFITFINDHFRYGHIYLLTHKSEALDSFKKYKLDLENQLERKIKLLRTDRGGEYIFSLFKSFCEDHGIRRHYTMPYSPQSSGKKK